ncbi:MAG: hypothetical protein A3K19_03455 [Lentisphaerae bacterium RIFOXYB12_FULL_65_16]|nr:MAG: hypothetical protein A3K18_01235 [Lentisphaerae bacterium RIFOXYA12_64_32]OGV86624.1 MAG: hypothetical protein A3K19_03455 [Lentisphaerae bacterium RIFOXYB12_FULL_65_16]
MRTLKWLLVLILSTWGVRSTADVADWPTWRYDAGRTACSPTDLPDELHLQWRRELGSFAVAWPLEARLQFDACYEPVVMGHRLFVGSPGDGSVTAYDTASGARCWRFYTDGPVRLAPVAWQGKVYAASDDGRVYCLDAETGAVRWVFRAAPAERPDLRHLGNNRLISAWPVRGGLVIADGVLYCGSGVWPTMGTFVHALDAETGKALWVNDRLNYLTNIRTDHNRIADSALAAQGYLVLTGGRLVVPNGRSMPVGLDPKTGTLLYAIQGYRNGHCRVAARDSYIYVGASAVLDITTGREMGERWHEGNEETPQEYSERLDLFETPCLAYKFVPACDAWSALGPGVVYGARAGVFYAYDTAQAKKTTYESKHGERVLLPGKWDVPLLWKFKTPYEAQKWQSNVTIRAGHRLYGHTGRILMAIDIPAPGVEPKLAWETELPGTPVSMLAADDRLFVVTQEGDILCFGASIAEPVTYPRLNDPLVDGKDAWSRRAADVLKTTGVTEGYGVVLGVESGRLVEELLRQSELKIIAVDADRVKVDALRDRLVAAGVYGVRVEALVADPFTLPAPPYLASLLVSESLNGSDLAAKLPVARLVPWLHPYGGVACLDVAEDQRAAFSAWHQAGVVEGTDLSYTGNRALVRRAGALPGSAYWTHEGADAANTYFSHDERVKAPLGVLWYGDGEDYGFKKHKDYHSGVKPEVVNGVLVAFDDGSKNLRAYDVYTGRRLWQQTDADPFTRFASMPDGIYVAGGNTCVVYEPYSGKVLKRFTYHAGEAPDQPLFVADIRVGADVVVIAAAFKKVRSIPEGLYNSDVLVGLDRGTGLQLWVRPATERFNQHGLALGQGLVFVADSPSADKVAAMKRDGKAPETVDSTIIALDARTGDVKWQRVFANPFLCYHDTSYPLGSIQSFDDALFYSDVCNVLIVQKDQRYRGVTASTGEPLWEIPKSAGQPIMVQGEFFYNQGGGAFDVRTGKSLPSKARVVGGNGCNHAVAGEHFIFRRTFTAAFFDVHDGRAYYMRNVRSGCTNNLIAADGVLSVPCFSVGCVCNHPLETSFCLVHMPGIEDWAGTTPVREPLPLGERDPAKLRPRPKGQ